MVSIEEAIRVYTNSVADFAYRKGPLSTQATPSDTDPEVFHDLLCRYNSDTVFTHVGLSGVKSAFGQNPYSFLFNELCNEFNSVLAPGYTPQFRESGEFDIQNSEPAYGAWSRLFLGDSDHRTDDPIHSILVNGPYRFNGCNTRDTFAQDGCFAQIDTDNILIFNIGTPWLMTTQHHYIERRCGVPYQEYPTFTGNITYKDGLTESVKQRNDSYTLYARRAARKVQRDAVDVGVVEEFNLNGLLVLVFRAQEYRRFIAKKIQNDPYYLVSACQPLI
ncbi:AAC(3) family N-acetyltransferase [Natronococcus jeotgali]|uniref:AAC(3) family N-acetyltransferase n=1 Tax=Natronococcus jeotgali TaxID=413812 RepID=UPI000A046373